jgi:hypothetical protein
MLTELVQAVVGPVVAGFWSHLNLGRYGSIRYLAATRGIRAYQQEEDFWRDVIASNTNTPLQIGDVVELTEFQLTEWVPRAPGVWWTDEGRRRRDAASGYAEGHVPGSETHEVYSPRGKYLMVSGALERTDFFRTKEMRANIVCCAQLARAFVTPEFRSR